MDTTNSYSGIPSSSSAAYSCTTQNSPEVEGSCKASLASNVVNTEQGSVVNNTTSTPQLSNSQEREISTPKNENAAGISMVKRTVQKNPRPSNAIDHKYLLAKLGITEDSVAKIPNNELKALYKTKKLSDCEIRVTKNLRRKVKNRINENKRRSEEKKLEEELKFEVDILKTQHKLIIEEINRLQEDINCFKEICKKTVSEVPTPS
ncbi:hypothetical protein M3P05_13720 [Sansalvadorimonas sp. 2012CJ34-2]|uniref:BZIP domain-containing protein n=1 Tax=Parendozoicomonas callyspongiae TaxID=2942213 RepID=A0ABT0PHY4_9GAMM|nr:hypothetical protein [Sansalvadorimonas sp. 2012CJ34-2]MCL6270984.1 hypothetical protein [Sansalvadorimonas sp. 2012CJ34-2]